MCELLFSIVDLEVMHANLRLPSYYELVLPRKDDMVMSPQVIYFTIYLAYFTSGFIIPPPPFLAKIVRNLDISLS